MIEPIGAKCDECKRQLEQNNRNLALTAVHPAKPDSITKEAYSATQFGRAAIDIFGGGGTVCDVTTDKRRSGLSDIDTCRR